MCACVCPFIAGALLVWGNRFEGERERESATDERRRMDGLLYGEERERERYIQSILVYYF